MFIDDFNISWMDHPFLNNSVKVRNNKLIEKIADCGIHEVYIDTARGLDVADAPTEVEVKQGLRTGIDMVIDPDIKAIGTVPIQEELVRAKEIKREAKETIHNIMEDIRFGNPIKKDKVEHVVMKMVSSIFRNQNALISLGRIRTVDEYTYMHSMSVCILMISFGKHLRFDLHQLKDVGVGAMLHDIGKMKIPQEILHSKKQLSDEEYEKMKEHVKYGRILLEETPGIAETSILVAAQHHERLDGSGYPNGLIGNDISKYAQIAAIVDVYDALTSERSYKHGLPPTEALKKLFEWSERYFNGELVQQFIRCVGIYPVGSLVRLGSGLIAIVLNNDAKNLLHPVVRVIYDTKKGKYTVPYDIDLSHQAKKNNAYRITSYESPDEINVVTEMYL